MSLLELQIYIQSDQYLIYNHQMSSSVMELQPTNQELSNAGVGLGFTICVLAVILGLFNLAFIVPNLIYAEQGTLCVTTIPDGYSFSLATWLQVDAYIRIAIISLLLFAAIISCISLEYGAKMLICSICVIVIYSVFQLAWLIVGSVLFWGKLNPTGICSGGVQAYVFAMLIISYVAICCNCLYGIKNRKDS